MAWFKTKQVKKCICGKEPRAVIIYDDRMQARGWLMALGTLSLMTWGVLSVGVLLSGEVSRAELWNELKSAWWFAVLIIYWLFLGFFWLKYKRIGHSLKCAARQAFLKVI